VLSIDEMWVWLPYNLREPAAVEAVARRIKETVAREVSPVIKVSIGAGPNKYLAKIASKMRKPDGLMVIEHRQLPGILHPLELRELTGIGGSTEARLRAAGIRSVESLCAAGRPALREAWGGVLGERLWHLLRGEEIPDPVFVRKSIGHSHVLPPDRRPPERAWPVLCKLLHKACERLRSHALLTGSLTVRLDFPAGPAWSADAHTVETDSTIALMHLMERLWQDRPEPARHLLKVSVVLTRLCAEGNHTPQLFPTGDDTGEDVTSDAGKHQRLDATVDKLRARYGRGVVYFGSVQESRDAAPMRISFTHIPDPDLEQD